MKFNELVSKKVIPINTKKQRLVIYKRALKFVKTLNPTNEGDFGLCIYLKEMVGLRFHDLDLPETDTLYPEFGQFVNRYKPVKYLELCDNHPVDSRYYHITNEWRIQVLKDCIKLCSE